MIYTITLNPSLDKTVVVKNLVFEDVNRVEKIYTDPGGKGINVSRVIHKFRGDTTSSGLLGGYTGEHIEKLLIKKGINTDFVYTKGETRTNILIFDTGRHTQAKINEPGPLISANEIDLLLQKILSLSLKVRILVLAGSIPPGVPLDIYCKIIKICHRKNILTILDADTEALKFGIKANPFLIKLNIHEIERLLGKKLFSKTSLIEGARTLSKMGIKIVVVSQGEKGVIVVKDNHIWESTPPKVQVSSTVGAGESFLAGFSLMLLQKKEMEEVIRFATACGTAAVLTPGTKLCRKEDVESLLNKVRVKRID
ncbi:MAG: 1-phosphofructokinase [bacterium]|nr:1-phosphofructokinase [bacterium]